jgi:branched-subunit amino acid ABC-type transport system permease component
MRAVADNRRLAEVCGLQTKRVTDVTAASRRCRRGDMNPIEFYALTLGSLALINAIAAMGLNLQFGVSGILNLASSS